MTSLRLCAVLALTAGCAASGQRAGDRPGYFYRSLAELQRDTATNGVMHIRDCPPAALTAVANASPDRWRQLRYPTFSICLPADWVLTRDGWQGEGGVLAAVQADEEFFRKNFLPHWVHARADRNYDRLTIAGSVAEIWDEAAQPRRDAPDHYAYAVYGLWRDRNFYVTGRASTRQAVNAQRLVMQTVRFTTE